MFWSCAPNSHFGYCLRRPVWTPLHTFNSNCWLLRLNLRGDILSPHVIDVRALCVTAEMSFRVLSLTEIKLHVNSIYGVFVVSFSP